MLQACRMPYFSLESLADAQAEREAYERLLIDVA